MILDRDQEEKLKKGTSKKISKQEKAFKKEIKKESNETNTFFIYERKGTGIFIGYLSRPFKFSF